MSQPFDIEAVRADFPFLESGVAFFDTAASAQKPRQVLEAVDTFYRTSYANIHRGNHRLSRAATEAYELARQRIAKAIHAPSEHEVVFTRGATEAINLVASCWGPMHLREGDEILLTMMEHHANIVPWQLLAQRTGASLRVIPVDEHGELQFDDFEAMLSERTKLLALVHVSNALGTCNPVETMTRKAKEVGATVLIDAAQSVPHFPVDVRELGCDFLTFSGHKVYGPTGIGVLWGHRELLDAMPPYQGGGDMIDHVSFEGTTFKPSPARFEAGTPHIAGAVGLAAAFDYLDSLDRPALEQYEQALLLGALKRMQAIEGLHILGNTTHRIGVISFYFQQAHHQDVADILDSEDVAVRTGHHCTEPLMHYYGIKGTVRASFGLYNNEEDVDRLLAGLEKAARMLG